MNKEIFDIAPFWEKIREGDEWAFQKLYDDYSDLLFGYGMKITANEDFVSNTIQSLFIYIYDKRKNLSTPKNISSYLCVSLRRMMLADLKKSRSSDIRSIDTFRHDSYNFELEIDAQEAMIKAEISQEQVEALQKGLDNMSDKQREILYLKYYKDMSAEEISEILKIKVQTVRNLSTLALNSLRAGNLLGLFLLLAMYKNTIAII